MPVEQLDRVCPYCQGPMPDGAPKTQVTCSRSCAGKMRTTSTRGRFTGGRSKVGKRADLDNQFFRSAWEANWARYLNYLVKTGEIVRWEYEPESFPFPVKRGNKQYLPDFKVWTSDTEYRWEEVKGYLDKDSQIKLRRFALHHPEESAKLVLVDRKVYQAMLKAYQDILEFE